MSLCAVSSMHLVRAVVFGGRISRSHSPKHPTFNELPTSQRSWISSRLGIRNGLWAVQYLNAWVGTRLQHLNVLLPCMPPERCCAASQRYLCRVHFGRVWWDSWPLAYDRSGSYSDLSQCLRHDCFTPRKRT